MNIPKIPISCNCHYQDGMFQDLQKVWKRYYKRHNVMANDFAYTMIQLATYYLKKADEKEEQIIEFAKTAIESVQMGEESADNE